MTDLLSPGQRTVLARVCDLLVPGSAAVEPAEYIARLLPGMPGGDENALHAAIGVLASVTDRPSLAALAGSAAFERLRALAIEAYYGDFAPAGHTGPTGYDDIGLAHQPRDWSFLGRPAPSDTGHASPPSGAEVIVVGSGAGGGMIAAELADVGVDVLLIEAGGFPPATPPSELEARHRLWWPPVVADDCGVALLGRRCVGGSMSDTFPAPEPTKVRLLTWHTVRSVSLEGRSVRGVRCVGPDTTVSTIAADTVVLAAGALRTPQILLRSEEFMALDTPSTRLVGRTLGLRPTRIVYGWFAQPQDCRLTATTTQQPVALAQSLVDEDGRPMWGEELAAVMRDYRHWVGLPAAATDDNTGVVELDAHGDIVVSKRFSPAELSRLDTAREYATGVLVAAGAGYVVTTGLTTTHTQGSVRMGGDPTRSVVDSHGRAHDVRGLYVGDSSLIPSSLSVDPSLTVMALAAKVASHIVEELPT